MLRLSIKNATLLLLLPERAPVGTGGRVGDGAAVRAGTLVGTEAAVAMGVEVDTTIGLGTWIEVAANVDPATWVAVGIGAGVVAGAHAASIIAINSAHASQRSTIEIDWVVFIFPPGKWTE